MQRPRAKRGSIVLAAATLLFWGCHPSEETTRSFHHGLPPTFSAEELFQIGLFHGQRGDLLRAEQYLSAAREQGHDEPATVYWLVRVCVSAGRLRSALQHSAAYLRDHPESWGLRLVVASLYEALGDLREAQLNLEQIVAAKPDEAVARYRLALLYRRQAALRERALPHLKAYLEIAPEGAHAAEVRELEADLEVQGTR